MSVRQTRNMCRSWLNTPVPSKIAKREKGGSDEGSSTSADESGGEAWNSKNDGADIKQCHYGGKRRRTGRGRAKRGAVNTDKKRRKRVNSEYIDIEPKEDMEDKASREEEEEINATANDNKDEGKQAESEDDVPEQEPETTTRRSGRATKIPDRFDEERYQPFGAPVQPTSQANITKALRKLKESRAPSRQGISRGEIPDPIASFSDHDHDMAIDPPIHQGPTDEDPLATDLPLPSVEDERPIKPKPAKPRKSALKPKTPSGPRKKKAKVIIDESRNQTRTVKIISSTSSDIGRHPSLPIPRGPKRFGVRSRRTVPVMGISPYTGKRAVQRYEYVVSSDSTESEDEDMIDPAEFREWIKMKREQEKQRGAFLLTLAARINDLPTTSTTQPPTPSTTLSQTPTLPPASEPVWTKPFSLTPIRPRPPINPVYPPHQEQEKVSDPHRRELMIGMENVC